MDTCQPVPEVWNTECDSLVYPMAEQIREWKPKHPHPIPDVARPTIATSTDRPAARVFRGYHSEMSEDTRRCMKWLDDEVDDDYIAHWEGNTVE